MASNPTSDCVGISILTTSLSAVSRERRRAVTAALKRIIKGLGSASTVAYIQLYQESCKQSNIMIIWEMFEDAMKGLQDDDVIMIGGRHSVHILH